jgi:RNA polymerase sigma-70 factor, ECF subfamily
MNEISEDQVFLGIQSGNREIFGYLFLKYYEPLCYYAFGIIKSKENAEEIVQDVYVKLWEERSNLNIHTSVKSYLYKSVHNQCINYLDHQKIKLKFSQFHLQENRDLVSPVSLDYPIANLLIQELDDTINKAIFELPEQCRDVFIKIRHEEMSYAEVADVLGISVNTVKTQLQRAMAKLRVLLREYLPN